MPDGRSVPTAPLKLHEEGKNGLRLPIYPHKKSQDRTVSVRRKCKPTSLTRGVSYTGNLSPPRTQTWSKLCATFFEPAIRKKRGTRGTRTSVRASTTPHMHRRITSQHGHKTYHMYVSTYPCLPASKNSQPRAPPKQRKATH